MILYTYIKCANINAVTLMWNYTVYRSRGALSSTACIATARIKQAIFRVNKERACTITTPATSVITVSRMAKAHDARTVQGCGILLKDVSVAQTCPWNVSHAIKPVGCNQEVIAFGVHMHTTNVRIHQGVR